MTSRDHARRSPTELRGADGTRPSAGDRDPDQQGLPARLLTARERKGVDLHRAERETKIRAHYLAALERGDYRELPGAVYTKGFLRNYALYLNLDPDDVLAHWRRERGDVDRTEPVIAVPQPIVAPRPGLQFTTGVFVAALLTVVVVVMFWWLGTQLLRFSQAPTISVNSPALAVIEVEEDATSYTFVGSSVPNAVIEIQRMPGPASYTQTAAPDGSWSIAVELRRGRNEFTVTARDRETNRSAEAPVERIITVPFLMIEAPNLAVESPTDGAAYENGAIPITGRVTNAVRVTATAAYIGPVQAGGIPSPDPADPTATPGPTPEPPEPPPAQEVIPREDDTFSAPLELTAGRWSITVTAASREGKTVSLTRTVTVAYEGVSLAVSVTGGRAWLKVWVDDALTDETGSSGAVFPDGRTLTFSGERAIKVWTGSSGVTSFTVNGQSLGILGRAGVPEVWEFYPSGPPVKLPRA